jgi:nucleoprotein TPR
MATMSWDAGFLSGYLNIPEPTLNTIIDSPTAELVKAVLDAVAVKATEHQELEADKIRLDIELENAVRSAENRSQGLKATVDKALKDVDDLRGKLNAEGRNLCFISLIVGNTKDTRKYPLSARK